MHPHTQEICKKLNFTLINFLNGGAFKEVYKVSDSNGHFFALKIFKQSQISPRTLREIDALKRCNHPNIAKILDTDSFSIGGDHSHFLVETFCGGRSLAELANLLGHLPPDLVKKIGSCLIDCVAHLKREKLVHRDIKPENVVIDDSETVTLIDFGLVRDLANVSLTQSWLNMGPGTPFFASPEQLNNQKELIDWRSDQFSLGVTLCDLLYGFHPYQHPTDSQRSAATVERVATRNATFPMLTGKAFENVIIKMVDPWPIRRFHSIEALDSAWNLEN